MTEKNDTQPSLHDWLALGEIEVALETEKLDSKSDLERRRKDEIRRLPLLLRMLSASQPLSSLPSIPQSKSSTSSNNDVDDDSDPFVDQGVARLETVVATHSVAERVDALTCYHAPNITRKISRLPPLKKDKRKLEWNIQDLKTVADSPLGSPRKKRRHELSGDAMDVSREDDAIRSTHDGDDDNDEDDDMSIEDTKDTALDHAVPNDAGGGEPTNTTASSDSQEAMTTKSLTEIAKLVVASLQPKSRENREDEEGCSSVLLPVTTDALLSELMSDLDAAGSAGAVGGFDLGASCSALMHRAPVLRHRHVANALCRSAASQAVVLIGRMAANCPSAVPCLLRGCIDAIVATTSDGVKAHPAIANTAKAGVRSLASLSRREAVRARTVLQRSNVMVDVQLELAIEHDPVAAACLLNKHFSEYAKLNRSTSLKHLLDDNPGLLKKCFTCILEALCESSTSKRLSGRTILLLRAFSFLVLFGGEWESGFQVFSSDLVENACKELRLLQGEIFKNATVEGDAVEPRTEKDTYYRYFMCLCLSMYARVAITNRGEGSVRALTDKCLAVVFDGRSISLQSDVFASSIAYMLKARNSTGLFNVVVDILANTAGISFHDESIQEGFLETCEVSRTLSYLDSIVENGMADAAAMVDSSSLLQYVQTEECYHRADHFIRSILKDPLKCRNVLHSNEMCDLIECAVTAVKTQKGTAIPCVLPLQLQSLSIKIDWRKDGRRLSQLAIESQYLLQLLYSLYFLQEVPTSPFAIDPRDFPLAETLELAKLLLKQNRGNKIESELRHRIEQMAPEVSSQIDLALSGASSKGTYAESHSSVQAIRRAHCDALSCSIRECKRNSSRDPSGLLAEQSFVLAGQLLTSLELTVTAVQALVGQPNMPLPFLTCSGLCRDPLILLKAPLAVWRCRGLRRIALFSLATLLRANDGIIASASPTEEVSSELLTSRDAIVVKCLIMASLGGDIGKDNLRSFTDSAFIAMVREMVAKHVGLVAQVVRQEHNDAIVDWIIDFVPESINDSESFILLLSERSSLTAADKLETASAALRIAIAHGGRNESAAKALAYAAMTRLVSSFFLVCGPVGVPMQSLEGEDGTDVTQVCRNATFRMLNALQNVRGSRGGAGLQAECGLALQKLANLCKGESIMTGVSGPVAGRRKQLLKDIYDAATKAANCMGSGIKL